MFPSINLKIDIKTMLLSRTPSGTMLVLLKRCNRSGLKGRSVTQDVQKNYRGIQLIQLQPVLSFKELGQDKTQRFIKQPISL